MKKWHKVLIIIVCILAVLATAGLIAYKKMVKPVVEEKIVEVAEKVKTVINDDSFQQQIDELAQSMIDDGVIAVESIPIYNQLKTENEEKRRAQAEAAMPKPTIKQAKKATPTPAPTPTPTPEPTPTPTPITKQTLRDRLKAAMTADEFSFALSMYSRIDVGYAQSLLKSDRAAAKEYIYSKASPSEISRALEIYAKYSYLLK